MPCCWAATETEATSSRPPAAASAVCSASHQCSGIDLGRVGVRRRPLADERARGGVADDDLAGLGGRVDSGDEGHRSSGLRDRPGV